MNEQEYGTPSPISNVPWRSGPHWAMLDKQKKIHFALAHIAEQQRFPKR
ncbi:MAG: hypothetical protein IPF41_05120 [Flavobacteriales bacterium]|nr:hypothetical protein [Flavobacteriales bacterium]